jgi:hypothetical protein
MNIEDIRAKVENISSLADDIGHTNGCMHSWGDDCHCGHAELKAACRDLAKYTNWKKNGRSGESIANEIDKLDEDKHWPFDIAEGAILTGCTDDVVRAYHKYRQFNEEE